MPFETLQILLDLDSSALKTKFESAISFVSKNLKDIEGKPMNWQKMMNLEYFSSVNWSSLVNKIFTPANLIAFFSAMSAFGVTTMVQAQKTASDIGGALNLTPEISKDVVANARYILKQIGTQAGDINDTSSALGTFLKLFGGNMLDAIKVTTMLGQQLAITGGTFADIMPDLLNTLQLTNIKGAANAIKLIGSVFEAKGLAGANISSMKEVLTSLSGFFLTAGQKKLPIESIEKAVTLFGSLAGEQGITKANAAFKIFNDAVIGTNLVLSNAAGGVDGLVEKLKSGDVKGAFEDVAKGVNSLDSAQLQSVSSALGLTQAEVTVFQGWTLFKDALVSYAPTIEEIIDNTNKKFKETETAIRGIQKAWETLKGLFTPSAGPDTSGLRIEGAQASGVTTTPFAPGIFGGLSFEDAAKNIAKSLSEGGVGKSTSSIVYAPSVSIVVNSSDTPQTTANQVSNALKNQKSLFEFGTSEMGGATSSPLATGGLK